MLVSDHAAGKKIGDLLPPLRGDIDMETVSATPDEIAKASDIVFTAKKGSERSPSCRDAPGGAK